MRAKQRQRKERRNRVRALEANIKNWESLLESDIDPGDKSQFNEAIAAARTRMAELGYPLGIRRNGGIRRKNDRPENGMKRGRPGMMGMVERRNGRNIIYGPAQRRRKPPRKRTVLRQMERDKYKSELAEATLEAASLAAESVFVAMDRTVRRTDKVADWLGIEPSEVTDEKIEECAVGIQERMRENHEVVHDFRQARHAHRQSIGYGNRCSYAPIPGYVHKYNEWTRSAPRVDEGVAAAQMLQHYGVDWLRSLVSRPSA